MSATLNLVLDQGTDYSLQLADIIVTAGVESMRDLTGYTFAAQARYAYTDAVPAFSFSFSILNQSINPGLFLMKVDKAATSALSLARATKYRYDVERTDPSGNVVRILSGTVTINPEVTK